MATMTPEQRSQARHALGLPNKQKKSYRNRYCTDESDTVWSELVKSGLATMRPASSIPMGGSALFYLTKDGARLALESGETLCEEDFPNT